MSSGKVVIVTGASRGIGLAISQLLLGPNHACNLVVVARSQEALVKLKNKYDGLVEMLAGDLSDLSLGQRVVDLAVKKWGRLDGLVVNHGKLDPVERIADAHIDEWQRSFDVNVFSAIAMVKAALPELRKSHGRIVFTSSGAAVKGTSTWGCYGASKAVLNHLALTLAKEEPGVTTMAVRPGVVDTKMQEDLAASHFSNMDKEDADRFRHLKTEGKMLRPEQPGNVIARLVLDAPPELSGRFLNWDDQDLTTFQDS